MDDELRLEPANEGHCELLYQWVNDPATRSASFNSNPIRWEDHQRWFHERLKSEACKIWIAYRKHSPVGQVRFDLKGEHWEIAFSVAREWRGRGYGSILLHRGIAELSSLQVRGVLRFLGRVKPENAASAQSFIKAGFVQLADSPRAELRFFREARVSFGHAE